MKIKKLFSTLNLSIQKIIILVMVFALMGGAIAYADFVRTLAPTSGFGYGYGYGYSSGYGYGYGYHTSGSGVTDKELYGFFGVDGAAAIGTATSTSTTITVPYTTTYTSSTNQIEYGLTTSYGSTLTAVASEAAGSHSSQITGLTCNQTYYIRLTSTDAGSNVWYDTTSKSTDLCSTSGGGGGGGGFTNNNNNNNNGNNTGNNTTVGDGAGCLAGDSFSRSTGLRCPASISNAKPINFAFTINLKFGMTNSEVKELQKYLNSNGFPVATSGAGSPGNETNYFGSLTRKALAAFQKANGINPPAGFFGPITRAFIQAH